MLDHDRTLLALPVKASVTLLVELQGPDCGKPDEMAATRLEIETMSGTCRVNQGYRDLAFIPSPDILGCINRFCVKPSLELVPFELEPIGNQDRLPICCFDKVFQCLVLPVMDMEHFPIVTID